MPGNKPLTDIEAYELIHSAVLILRNKTAESVFSKTALDAARQQLNTIQAAMVMYMDGLILESFLPPEHSSPRSHPNSEPPGEQNHP